MSDPSERKSMSDRNSSGGASSSFQSKNPDRNIHMTMNPDMNSNVNTNVNVNVNSNDRDSNGSLPCQHGFGGNSGGDRNFHADGNPTAAATGGTNDAASPAVSQGKFKLEQSPDASMTPSVFFRNNTNDDDDDDDGLNHGEIAAYVTAGKDDNRIDRHSKTPSKYTHNSKAEANTNGADADATCPQSDEPDDFNIDIHAAMGSVPGKTHYNTNVNSNVNPSPAGAPLDLANAEGPESPLKPDQLPRRVLTFEPSPRGTSNSVSFSATSPPGSISNAPAASRASANANATDQNMHSHVHGLESTTPLKMSPLDGRHRMDSNNHSMHSHGYHQQHQQLRPSPAKSPSASEQPSHPPQGYGHGHGHGQDHGYGHGHGHHYSEYPPSHQKQPYPGQYGHHQQHHQQSYPTQAPTANNGNDYRPSPGPVVPPSHGQGQGQPYGSKYYHDEYSHPHPNSQPHPANANYSGGKEDLASGPGSGFHSSSPPFDRIHMPFMELNSASRSETKHFEDLMSSPGLNLSFSRGIGSEPRDRRTTRRVPYDLHDQPAFNEHSDSPINIHRAPGSASVTRYCTPIVTGGNDRSRVTTNTHSTTQSRQPEQNYRPSPPQGGNQDDYDYLRHYHRTFPTMRGGQPSPTRFDEPQRTSAGPGAGTGPHSGSGNGPSSATSPMYATPVFPRGGANDQGHHPAPAHSGGYGHPSASAPHHGSHGKYNQSSAPPPPVSSHHHGHSQGPGQGPPSHQMGGYYDPNNQHHGQHGVNAYPPPHQHHAHAPYPPRQDGHYPPPPPQPYNMGVSPYGPPPPYPGYPPSYGQPGPGPGPNQAHGNPHYPQNMGYPPNYNSDSKKRKKPETKRKAPKPPKRKKMYSDFVGVTYNKTHAKFQACITHYRKQYYLGRYKLASDAAKAYDQSAKMLKGEGWKINFSSNEEYLTAREKEMKIVEEKKLEIGMDNTALRKAYAVVFPTDKALREKLGLAAVGSASSNPKSFAEQQSGQHQPPANSNSAAPMQQQQQQRMGAPSYTVHPPQGHYTNQGPSSMMQHPQDYSPPAPSPNAAAGASANAGGPPPLPLHGHVHGHGHGNINIHQSHSQSTLAVTPSPNVQSHTHIHAAKNSTLMNEPLMSPGFGLGTDGSPSALSILGGTPFSMPGSTMKNSSVMKAPQDSSMNHSQRDLDPVSSNIFKSPDDKMTMMSHCNNMGNAIQGHGHGLGHGLGQGMNQHSESRNSDEREESDKGKGDLTAASALLMMNNH